MTGPGKYTVTGWDDECYPPEPGKRWLVISDPDGEEIAVVVQRRVNGEYNDMTAAAKQAAAQLIVSALNSRPWGSDNNSLPGRADLTDARVELESLYEWLSQSPAGEDHDLHGLDTAITVLSKLIERGPS